jgi:hypothetical protein
VLDRGRTAGRFRPRDRNVIELTEIMREIAETGHSSVPDDSHPETTSAPRQIT